MLRHFFLRQIFHAQYHLIIQFFEIAHVCEGTRWVVGVCSPMLIPRQLRFSLYSGAVITEDLMWYYHFFIVVLVLTWSYALCLVSSFLQHG